MINSSLDIEIDFWKEVLIMDKNTALNYMEKVVGYNLASLKPTNIFDKGDISDLTEAQNLIVKGKLPSKHMASYIKNFQNAMRFNYQNGVYSDNEDKKHEMKLEQVGEDIIDSNLVSF